MHAPSRSLPMIAVLAALALSACAGGGNRTPEGIPHPDGSELVLRVEQRGGFVMANFHLISLPAFTLTGDGQVIVQGAQPAIFPGPALPSVQVRRLSPAGIQEVLAAVAESRQFGASREWRGAQNFVADASDTVFTLHAEGREVVVSVYGLGLADMGGPQPLPADEQAVHAALSALYERLLFLDGWLADGAWADAAWRPYTADAARLVVRNADADEPGEDGIERQELAWPGPGDPAGFGEPTQLEGWRCGVVSGDDAVTWYRALAGANQLTRWTAAGHRYEVTMRPLLPDEPRECPQPA